jgi:hypothetical protein
VKNQLQSASDDKKISISHESKPFKMLRMMQNFQDIIPDSAEQTPRSQSSGAFSPSFEDDDVPGNLSEKMPSESRGHSISPMTTDFNNALKIQSSEEPLIRVKPQPILQELNNILPDHSNAALGNAQPREYYGEVNDGTNNSNKFNI